MLARRLTELTVRLVPPVTPVVEPHPQAIADPTFDAVLAQMEEAA